MARHPKDEAGDHYPHDKRKEVSDAELTRPPASPPPSTPDDEAAKEAAWGFGALGAGAALFGAAIVGCPDKPEPTPPAAQAIFQEDGIRRDLLHYMKKAEAYTAYIKGDWAKLDQKTRSETFKPDLDFVPRESNPQQIPKPEEKKEQGVVAKEEAPKILDPLRKPVPFDPLDEESKDKWLRIFGGATGIVDAMKWDNKQPPAPANASRPRVGIGPSHPVQNIGFALRFAIPAVEARKPVGESESRIILRPESGLPPFGELKEGKRATEMVKSGTMSAEEYAAHRKAYEQFQQDMKIVRELLGKYQDAAKNAERGR